MQFLVGRIDHLDDMSERFDKRSKVLLDAECAPDDDLWARRARDLDANRVWHACPLVRGASQTCPTVPAIFEIASPMRRRDSLCDFDAAGRSSCGAIRQGQVKGIALTHDLPPFPR